MMIKNHWRKIIIKRGETTIQRMSFGSKVSCLAVDSVKKMQTTVCNNVEDKIAFFFQIDYET